MRNGKYLENISTKLIASIIFMLVGLLTAVNVEAAATRYYVVANSGTNVGGTAPQDGTTDLVNGNANDNGAVPYFFKTLFSTTAPSGSSTQLRLDVGANLSLVEIGRVFLSSDYAVATTIAANPTGKFALRGESTNGDFTLVLEDYDPSFSNTALHTHTPFATATVPSPPGNTTTATNVTFTSNSHTIPVGHRILLRIYYTNNDSAARTARVYCNKSSSTTANSYIDLSESAGAPAITHTITPTAGTGGAISPSAAVTVTEHSSQAFTISHNANYILTDVLIDGVSDPSAVTSNGYTFSDVTANHTIQAVFSPTYTITPTAGANGTLNPGASVVVVSGGSQLVDITPNSGYTVQDVLVNGTSVGAVTSYTFTNVTSNQTISATFAVQTSLINNYNIVPPFVASGAPPNVMIMLSIETPMQGDAYPDLTCTGNPASSTYGCSNNASNSGGRYISSNYLNTKSYSGYFDPNKCYTYSGSAATGLFTPSSTTTNHQCTSAWSGNFLNYATTMALDSFRIAFTGGNRDVDTTTSTVLLAGRQTLGAGHSWYSIKQLASANLYTPYSGTIYIVRHEKGFSVCTASNCTVTATSGWPTTTGNAFSLRVKVCDTAAGLESFCNTSNNKPEGVLQKYSDRVRFGLVSYAMTGNASTTRDGGVLRSNMKWLPYKVGYGMKYHDSSGNVVSCTTMAGCTNPEAEWDANGIYVSNPDAAASSLSVSGGLINYINKFGYANGYKSYDPISELFYQSIRYFANNPNNTPTSPKPPSNYSYCNGITNSDDGFIAYCNNSAATSWRDAFVFPCSQSSIIAISDANPWLDKRIPGTAFTSAYGGAYNDYCGTGTLACDTDMPGLTNSVTYKGNSITGLQYWTDKIGDNDGLTPGSMNVGCVFTGTACTTIDSGTAKTVNRLSQVVGTAPWAGKENSYYIAGLAYYARMTNLRPDLAGTHTVTSYFIDTQEPNTSMLVGNRNMLYLAGKYGGFIDNDGDGLPFTDSTCGTSTPNVKCKEWDTNGTGFPDNYMFASDPTKVQTGLDQMLGSILKRLSSGTAASILNNSEGSGANLLQAVFYPSKTFDSGTESKWIGEIQNLWYFLDPNLQKTSIREDTNQDNILNLQNDKVVQFYFDSAQNMTLVNRYLDANGDGAADSNIPVDTVAPDAVLSLWKAGRRLWERDLATTGRTIYTSLNSTIGSTPQKFSKVVADGFLGITGVNTLLQVANSTEASTVIDYIHGIDQTGYRNRKVTILGCGLASCNREWKLSDIVSSTPKLISNVRLNSFNLPTPNGYNDKSYETFTNTTTYQNRGMVMVGANDGMLHAFKLGILKEIGSQFDKSKIINTDGTTANASSDLGVEQWAFIPKQALPYLKYLGDPQYNHLYYIDRTPLTIDASINRPATCNSGLVPDTSDCPKDSTSWRSVLIGGMGIGGGAKPTTDTCISPTNCVKTPVAGTGFSSYFALDVTDPAAPLYLWDFYGDPSSQGTLGYSTTGPAIVRISAKTKVGGVDTQIPDHANNGKWFAVFASGPTGPIDTASHSFKGESDQQLRIFVVDLATGTLLRTIDKFSDGTTSLPANAFAGSLASSVIDTDRSNQNSNGFYSDDAVYIGYVEKDTSTNTWTKGGVLRLQTMESRDPADWKVSTVINGIGPVTTSVTKLQDRKNYNLWLYFGTGRFFYKQDDNSTTQQKLYGVKEPCYSTSNRTMQSTVPGGTINDIDFNCTDSVSGTLLNQTGSVGTAPATSIAVTEPGWSITLDPSDSISLTERVITDPIAATNGAVFFTTFKPSADICKFGGDSLIWALKYDTGGVPPSAAMQGRALMQVSTGAFAEISLSTAFINPGNLQYDGRRLASPISGVPPTAQGLSLLTNPKPIKKLLHIQER